MITVAVVDVFRLIMSVVIVSIVPIYLLLLVVVVVFLSSNLFYNNNLPSSSLSNIVKDMYYHTLNLKRRYCLHQNSQRSSKPAILSHQITWLICIIGIFNYLDWHYQCWNICVRMSKSEDGFIIIIGYFQFNNTGAVRHDVCAHGFNIFVYIHISQM